MRAVPINRGSPLFLSMARWAQGAASVALALVLAACGGGGSSEPPFVYTPPAAVVAAKRVNSSLVFGYQGAAFTATAADACGQTLTNKTVYEQAHTVVFAADGVSELDQQEVAEYAEASVVELRRVFAITTAVGVYLDKKIYVCVQPQKPGGGFSAYASYRNSTNNSSPGGVVVVRSPSQYFGEYGRGNFTIDGTTYQASYQTVFVHEMTHLVESLGPVFFSLDTWFTEGIANYVARGKPSRALDLILGSFRTINPLSATWPTVDQTDALNQAYSTAQAVLSYLLSPTGANNTLATYRAMLATLRADSAAWVAACQPNGFSTPVCTNTSAEFEALRKAKFVAAFEGAFKERDGSAMKLYAGTNNLKDSIVARITAWW